MNHQRLLKILFLFAIVFLFNRQTAEACSCGAPPNVLEAFEGAKNIVVVKAVHVEKVGKDETATPVDGVKWTKMVVEKVYKGKIKAGEEMIFGQGGGADCIWTFNEQSIGKRYLFYLGEGVARWLVFGCGRSSTVEGAADDLLFLEKLDKVRGKTRISGTINFQGYDALPDSPTLEGRKVKIIGGGGTFNLKTDKNGVYEIYDLPPGRYEIVPELPKGWRVNQFYLRYTDILGKGDDDDDDRPIKEYAVKLEARRHATVDFHFEIDNRIRGKILAPDGSPMRRVCVRLFPPTGVDKNFTYLVGCVERDGADTFEIDEIPPGSYILAVNDEGVITANEPFKTVYYPGTFDLEKASVINIGIGGFLENIDIHIPKIEELITVQGVFLYSDGKPVVDESVSFFSATNNKKYESDASAATDAQGRFTLKILKGMKGRIYGSMYTYRGEFENCPRLEALIREGGNSSYQAFTNEIEISGENNVFDVELKFTFPGCKKSKD